MDIIWMWIEFIAWNPQDILTVQSHLSTYLRVNNSKYTGDNYGLYP